MRRAWLMSLVLLAGCSFAVSASKGRSAVHRWHAWIDAGLSVAPMVGCGVAAVAWADPDAFAPITDDATSWKDPLDRTNTQHIGATLTPIACTVAAAFLASTIYGQVVSPEGSSYDAQILAPAAAFASGFAAARYPQQSTPTPVHRPPACTSDFSCGIGYTCVKNRYEWSGVCAKAVDSFGVPTFKTPDLDSVGPNTGDDPDCMRDGCPIGFRCDARSGFCLK